MKKKYGLYCSGNASCVLKFYEINDVINFPVNLVFYDGEDSNVSRKLFLLFGDKLVTFENVEKLKGKMLSQHISNLLLQNMQAQDIDFLFCFGNIILKQNLLDQYKNRIINFHPSILPAFPGIKAIDQALASSVQLLGNTAHFIDNGIDTGPIIMQSVIKRKDFTCYEDVLKLQLPMLEKIWLCLDEDKINVENNKVTIQIDNPGVNYFLSI